MEQVLQEVFAVTTLASLTAMLEPLLIVTLGVIVGFIVISMFLPLMSAISQLQQAT